MDQPMIFQGHRAFFTEARICYCFASGIAKKREQTLINQSTKPMYQMTHGFCQLSLIEILLLIERGWRYVWHWFLSMWNMRQCFGADEGRTSIAVMLLQYADKTWDQHNGWSNGTTRSDDYQKWRRYSSRNWIGLAPHAPGTSHRMDCIGYRGENRNCLFKTRHGAKSGVFRCQYGYGLRIL